MRNLHAPEIRSKAWLRCVSVNRGREPLIESLAVLDLMWGGSSGDSRKLSVIVNCQLSIDERQPSV